MRSWPWLFSLGLHGLIPLAAWEAPARPAPGIASGSEVRLHIQQTRGPRFTRRRAEVAVSPETGATTDASQPLTSVGHANGQRFPEYPEPARLRGEEGTVTVRLRAGPENKVQNVELLVTSGSRDLDEAVLRFFLGTELPGPDSARNGSMLRRIHFRLTDPNR